MGTSFTLFYIMLFVTRLLPPKILEEQSSSREDFGDGWSDGEKSESVEIRSSSEMESSAGYHFHVVENSQQRTAVKLGVHKSMVKMAIYFWKVEASSGKLLSHVVYGERKKRAINHPCWTSAVTNIP